MPNDIPFQRKIMSTPYDPAARLFLAQDRRPAHLEGVGPGELSPLQRALLVIDGTVTSFLSAWALEPVIVRPLAQCAGVLPGDAGPAGGQPLAAPWLEAPAGTPVMTRAVLLVGADSQRLFAFAESVICTGRLPAALRAGLEAGGLSLGQLLLVRPATGRQLHHGQVAGAAGHHTRGDVFRQLRGNPADRKRGACAARR